MRDKKHNLCIMLIGRGLLKLIVAGMVEISIFDVEKDFIQVIEFADAI